ncbi:GTPase HflX [Peptococcaceae bacterium 1198_IL3148]
MESINNEVEEKALLIGLDLNASGSDISLNELKGLAETAGAVVVDVMVQRRSKPDSRYFFGRGKLYQVAERCQQQGVSLVICDQELTPSQQRNVEEIIGVKVIDRTQLILDIFAQRAQTKEGKLQVELAQLNYMLPRLIGRGTELSRLGGGIGTRGPGETKLEVDRRRIRQRITDLKRELALVKKHRALHRKNRQAVPFPLVSLVGYTNAGKSTLLNTLTGSDVLVEDKLFATLDPTTRRVVLPTNETILLTDTVGFIQNLPHHLVAAFRATLEEVVEADLLLHVVDASHPNYRCQIQAVEKVLTSLGVEQKSTILVLNKIDVNNDNQLMFGDINHSYYVKSVNISAKNKYGLDDLLKAISEALSAGRTTTKIFVPFNKSFVIQMLHHHGQVLHQEYQPDGVELEVEMERVWIERILAKLT